MNLKEALKELDNKDINKYYLVRQKWIDSGSNMKLLPYMASLIGLTNESFFANDWIIIEGNLDDK